MDNEGNAAYEMLALFEMTPDLVCIAGEDGYFRKVNPAVINKLGYTEKELFARPIASFIHPDDRAATSAERNELLKGKTLINFQNRYIAKNGTAIWLEWTSIFIPHKEIVFAIAKDITVTKHKEKETELKYQAYKNMATHFKSRAEEERKYLAHDLHEEVAQLAASVKMHIAGINYQQYSLPAAVTEKLATTLALSDRLVRKVRRISFSVSPNMLVDLGFNATLEWECKEFQAVTGVPCHYISECREDDIPEEIKIDFYRICQEALSNVMEHAEAKSVFVLLNSDNDATTLSIMDDGKGFNTDILSTAAGLMNMQQLAISINGSLQLQSKPGEGTKVTVLVKKMANSGELP